jgi:Transcriptional regulatory protein, C terminal
VLVVNFGLLGPLSVRDGARPVAVSAPRQRVLLATLLLSAGRVASSDALAEMVWDGRPPAGARGALHSAIQRLRTTLDPAGAGLITTRPSGYLMQAGDGEFDVRQFAVLAALAAETGGESRALVISAIDGTAGVGKTTLAVHFAHQVADRFPDGQLYVNLRGFGPAGPPMTPGEAIRIFLEVLGVSAAQIPASLDAQAGLYRSLLAGRQVLVLLDNAAGVDQVRPLLPAGPGCLVLVTSRSQLTGLVATEGAYPLTRNCSTPWASTRNWGTASARPTSSTRWPSWFSFRASTARRWIIPGGRWSCSPPLVTGRAGRSP